MERDATSAARARCRPGESSGGSARQRVLSGRCDRGRECSTGSRRPRGHDGPTRRCAALREKGGQSVARGRPDAGATARCRGRPIPERAAPSFNARERTGSGAPRADDASWRVVRARWRAVLMCKGATLATGRSNPRAQGRLPGRGVGPGWGRPAPRPSTHRRAAGPDGFHLSIREPARGGASPQTRAPGDAAPSAGRRATAPCRAEGPQSRRARARPLGRAHLPHRRPRCCFVFFAKNRPIAGAPECDSPASA
jgi:hypothetical protein